MDPVAILTGFATGLVKGVFTRAAVGAAGAANAGELQATIHGAGRLADASPSGVAEVRDVMVNATRDGLQRDGARVYIQQVGERFNVVVMGERGLVMNLKTISEKSLTRLAKRYGYEHLLP